jgi:CRISPR-associated endonuclease Csn1
MKSFDVSNRKWPTQVEARQLFAEDERATDQTTGGAALPEQRVRYAHSPSELLRQTIAAVAGNDHAKVARLLSLRGLRKSDRHFLKKHPNSLPPAPMISNPVVRKAVHEVRRHLNHYLRRFKTKPDRVVIEFVRGVKNSAKERNLQLAANREREKERKQIEGELEAWGVPRSNWRSATLRIRLCKEQAGICPFSIEGANSTRIITPRMAAEGTDVEIEHIIPESITGRTLDFNNVVLCFRKANRDKRQRTPLDWLGPDGLAEVLRRLEDTNVRKNKVKWERIQAATPDLETYRASQLTDTAYAARQVAEYINSALYSDSADGQRRVFTTKGQYTARLRADWGLYESEIDREHGLEPPLDERLLSDDPELEQALRRARKDPTKDRIDHRHHALDALVVALTPEYIARIGEAAAKDREYYERVGRHPRRTSLVPPWGGTLEFRKNVIAALDRLVVAHRISNRRLVGALHKENPFGEASEYPGLYSFTIPARPRSGDQGPCLKPASLKSPKCTYNHDGKPKWSIEGRGQNSVVRDPGLRKAIIKCLEDHGVSPTRFTRKDIQRICDEGKFCIRTKRAQVPIKSITMVRTLAKPVPIVGRDGVKRFFASGSNHHMEIELDESDGKWKVRRTITAYKAAMRNVKRLKALRDAGVPCNAVLRRMSKAQRSELRPIISKVNRAIPIVDRKNRPGRPFVMSLTIGEIIRMRHKTTKIPGFFVVVKINQKHLFVAPHWDARPSKKRNGLERETLKLSPAQLQKLGEAENEPPYKVQVSPLGDVRRIKED